ncbi:antitoxin [Streptomyces echinoruber]|uniref:Antitoxin n=1 Tax=Streptomyces echinoruber TaxID=68898 RepID=A0A918RIG7_9ACTN|nr:antitoxin [Streptomyces echinoruber]GGZ99133.1 hypothetical protein GCM10010389_42930 [Streptomyces echinoruber]
MGIFDRFKNQAKHRAKGMSGKAEKRGDDRTGGTYEDRVDDARRRAEGTLGMDRERPDQPPRDQP